MRISIGHLPYPEKDIITPQVTRKIVHACNVMNEFTGQGKRLITEITTPDFF